ncbi:hypothetical protein BX616_003207, partial [Lobosporangium transversale]
WPPKVGKVQTAQCELVISACVKNVVNEDEQVEMRFHCCHGYLSTVLLRWGKQDDVVYPSHGPMGDMNMDMDGHDME